MCLPLRGGRAGEEGRGRAGRGGQGDVSAALGEQTPQTRREEGKGRGRPTPHVILQVLRAPSCYPASALDDTELNTQETEARE